LCLCGFVVLAMDVRLIKSKLQSLGDKQRAQLLQGFFKTGPGEYGEGDLFLGIRVPLLRKFAIEYQNLPLDKVEKLLKSPFHEERALALMILLRVYSRGDDSVKKKIYEVYLRNTRFINNWDLVDISAGHIVGHYLLDKDRKPIYVLARSKSLWERRISIISTYRFIKHGQYIDTLQISEILLSDKEDLIHKAVGWMLRAVGNHNPRLEEEFLKRHYKKMPRTMLRYAIERFPKSKRQEYLRGEF
jgi:3-methyladenine DNA glycosylase AlkD